LILKANPDETWDPLKIGQGLDFPRGAITEIHGGHSSGRTTLLHTALAAAAAAEEVCALVDTSDAFDPESAAGAGVALDRLLWVRCGGNAEHALRAADLLIQGGGFGLVAMDLGDTPPRTARRISLASWYRLRRAIEQTRTVMVVTGLEPYARQCATLSLEARRGRTEWSRLFEGAELHFERRKPAGRSFRLGRTGEAAPAGAAAPRAAAR
jgi:hypothetical protein